jgi:putative ABC transport system ATP-binding protein
MVTHNMNQAIRYGNSMIMLHEGKIIYKVEGDAKMALTVEEVVRKFGADLKDETLLS